METRRPLPFYVHWAFGLIAVVPILAIVTEPTNALWWLVLAYLYYWSRHLRGR